MCGLVHNTTYLFQAGNDATHTRAVSINVDEERVVVRDLMACAITVVGGLELATLVTDDKFDRTASGDEAEGSEGKDGGGD
jgi:hypothetical protein